MMLEDLKKDFFHIGKMTESFRADNNREQQTVWSDTINLAIAQQLAVISGSLGRIAEALEEALDRAKQK